MKLTFLKKKCSNCKVQHEDSADLHEILSVLKQKFKTESTSVSEKLQIIIIILETGPLKNMKVFFLTQCSS